jgi:hypothetical protein
MGYLHALTKKVDATCRVTKDATHQFCLLISRCSNFATAGINLDHRHDLACRQLNERHAELTAVPYACFWPLQWLWEVGGRLEAADGETVPA